MLGCSDCCVMVLMCDILCFLLVDDSVKGNCRLCVVILLLFV